MKKTSLLALSILLLAVTAGFPATVELRNILTVDGLQENPILGYGIVVGLKGTGDSETGSQTKEILSRIGNNFGIQINADRLKPKNSAVVIVSGMLSPFAQPGSRIDVKVSSVFDARSLDGGELVITPMIAGDNQIYAVAQGTLQTEKTAKGVMGYVPQGAIIQKQVESQIVNSNNEVVLNIQETLGLSSVNKVAEAIRTKYPDSNPVIQNNKIVVKIPDNTKVYPFLSELFLVQANVDEEPSVLVDSRSGIVVSGGNVQISETAVTYNGTRVTIGGGESGKTDGSMKLIKSTATVQELVDDFNQIGASGPDIARILQLLYRNGNLKGKLTVQ